MPPGRSPGVAFQPSLAANRVPALAGSQFIDRAEAVHPIGPPGTGKTHPSLALGVEAVGAGRSICFGSRDGALRDRIRRCRRFGLLIVDEIGRLPVAPGGGDLFFQLVNARREKGVAILASNRGVAERGDIFGDSAAALLDRLLRHAVAIRIEGASRRLREHADLPPETIRFKPNAAANPLPPTLKRRARPPKKAAEPIPPAADRQPARPANSAAPLPPRSRATLTRGRFTAGAACASPSSTRARSPPSERNSTRNTKRRSRRWPDHPSPAFPASPRLDRLLLLGLVEQTFLVSARGRQRGYDPVHGP